MISVIVPVYNTEKYLDKCMKSILSQKYKDFEVILINDGSTDGSPRMCEEWAKQDARVRVIHQENKGLAQTRNVGLAHAKGDYIAWVDSDDYVKETFLSHMMDMMQQSGADMVMCSFESDIDGEIKFEGKERIHEAEYDSDGFLDMVYTYGLFSVVWNKLVKKSAYQDVVFPTGRLFEDSSVARKVAKNCNKIVVTGEPLYYYRRHSESITMKKRDAKQAYSYIKQFVQWLQEDICEFRKTGEKRLEAFASKHLCDAIINSFMELDDGGKREIKKIYGEYVGCVLSSEHMHMKTKVKYGVARIHIPIYIRLKSVISGR